MRVLITGAFGFAGRFLIDELSKSGTEILGTYVEETPPRHTCNAIRLDITDAQACRAAIETFKPEVVYHLAAVTFVPEAEANFSKTLQINVVGTNNLFHAVQECGLTTKVVLVSSAQVYGKICTFGVPIDESCAVKPFDAYSVSKAMAELLALRYQDSFTGSSVIVRPFNHIGPGQRVDFVVSSFAYQLARIFNGKAPPTIQVGNLEAKRDFTDVRDIVRGYHLAALKGQGVYNLSSGTAVSIQHILDTLIEISGLKVEIKPDPSRLRASEIPELFGSYEKAKRELAWEPRYDLRTSLRDVYEYWKNDKNG